MVLGRCTLQPHGVESRIQVFPSPSATGVKQGHVLRHLVRIDVDRGCGAYPPRPYRPRLWIGHLRSSFISRSTEDVVLTLVVHIDVDQGCYHDLPRSHQRGSRIWLLPSPSASVLPQRCHLDLCRPHRHRPRNCVVASLSASVQQAMAHLPSAPALVVELTLTHALPHKNERGRNN